jgi:methylmalonyl-CoA mutase C-terminal domain/subunit
LIAKTGLDGHDRGAKVISRILRDHGCEVIYTGLHKSIDSIVQTAVQEDVNAIGLSVMSGGHMTHFKNLMDCLHLEGIEDIIVFGGGVIMPSEIQLLKEYGVAEVFGPGTPLTDITNWINNTFV